jgi:hypothetical protein
MPTALLLMLKLFLLPAHPLIPLTLPLMPNTASDHQHYLSPHQGGAPTVTLAEAQGNIVRLQGEIDLILSEQALKRTNPAAQNIPDNPDAELEIKRIRKDMQKFTEIFRQGLNNRQSSYLAFSPAFDISVLRQVRMFFVFLLGILYSQEECS